MPRPLRRLLHRAVDLLADPCESHNPFAEGSPKPQSSLGVPGNGVAHRRYRSLSFT
jgi:hypothetical protein